MLYTLQPTARDLNTPSETLALILGSFLNSDRWVSKMPYQHLRPIHLIGALSPADVGRLVIRLVEVEGRRVAEPEVGEVALSDVRITCPTNSVSDDGCVLIELSATGKVAGGGELKGSFQVELHFAKGRERSVSDSDSLEMIKELVWPPVRDALNRTAYMLTATAEIRMVPSPRPGLLERMRWWAARRIHEGQHVGN